MHAITVISASVFAVDEALPTVSVKAAGLTEDRSTSGNSAVNRAPVAVTMAAATAAKA